MCIQCDQQRLGAKWARVKTEPWCRDPLCRRIWWTRVRCCGTWACSSGCTALRRGTHRTATAFRRSRYNNQQLFSLSTPRKTEWKKYQKRNLYARKILQLLGVTLVQKAVVGLLMALDVVMPIVTSVMAVLMALTAIMAAVRLHWMLLLWPTKQWCRRYWLYRCRQQLC